ncbi:hypothetical protein K438DRAFT_1945626 [Mycena galopus ATCC 62051]|nr:hypothetical protein K438DRAFT_1945626 [Mycena galopus ATCC 62051]
MLEPPSIRSITTCEEFVHYLQHFPKIMWDIMQTAKKVEEIRKPILCIIEAERQRDFTAGIKESHEIFDRVTSSLTRGTFARPRVSGSGVTRNMCYESITKRTRNDLPPIISHILVHARGAQQPRVSAEASGWELELVFAEKEKRVSIGLKYSKELNNEGEQRLALHNPPMHRRPSVWFVPVSAALLIRAVLSGSNPGYAIGERRRRRAAPASRMVDIGLDYKLKRSYGSSASIYLPQNRYIVWGLVTTSGIIYTAHQQRSSIKLGRVEVAIKSVEETLNYAKEIALFEIMRDINQCAKKAEEIRTSTSRILEAERQRKFLRESRSPARLWTG